MSSHPSPILYFSRGRGHGHAVPDAALLKCLHAMRPELQIVVASYGTGARTFSHFGIEVVDLKLPEENEFLATLSAATELIDRVSPQIVVAHEEFAALPAAANLGIPAVLISDWLPAPGTVMAEAVRHASSILIKEHPGFFPEPKGLQIEPRYTGPVCRKREFDVNQRLRLREELGLFSSGPVVTVVAGGWATEARAPLAEMVIAAFEALPDTDKQLVWVSSHDCDRMKSRLRGFRAKVLRFVTPIERLIAASDLVVTKATRCTLLDVARVGVPSISISHGLNPIDEVYCPRIPGNIALLAKAVTPNVLTYYITRGLRDPSRPPLSNVIEDDAFAEIVLQELYKLNRQSTDKNQARETLMKHYYFIPSSGLKRARTSVESGRAIGS